MSPPFDLLRRDQGIAQPINRGGRWAMAGTGWGFLARAPCEAGSRQSTMIFQPVMPSRAIASEA